MGSFHVKAQLSPLSRRKPGITCRFLVDTGATDIILPARFWDRLSLSAVREEGYELANRRLERLPVAPARLLINGKEVPVLAARTTDGEPLLGVVALEMAGLAVDPIRRRLVPVRRLLKGLNKCC